MNVLEDAIQFRHKEKHEARVAEAVWLLDAIEKNERLNQEYRIRLAELDAGGEPSLPRAVEHVHPGEPGAHDHHVEVGGRPAVSGHLVPSSRQGERPAGSAEATTEPRTAPSRMCCDQSMPKTRAALP